MLDARVKGCLVFTSSAAAVMPGPFVSLYNSTKAFLSAFGSSLAAEVRAGSPLAAACNSVGHVPCR